MRTAESARTSRRRRPLEGGTSRTSATHPCGPSHPATVLGSAHPRRHIWPFLRVANSNGTPSGTARRFDSEQVDHEFSRSDEEDQDEDQSDGARSESAEAPPRPEVRPDEHNREEERNEDEVGGPREPAGPDREVYDIRCEAHGRRRDDQEGRSPDRLPGQAAKAVHHEGDIQQTSAD